MIMHTIDDQLSELYTKIINEGSTRPETRMFWKDGTPAYYTSVFGGTITLDANDGFPITTKKFTPFKSLSSEILWIAQKMTSDVQVLRDLGSKVWNEWELPDGTIGSAYGHQLAKQKYFIDRNYISDKSLNALGKLPNDLKISDGKIELNQMEYVIQQLIDNPYSRQIMTDIWTISDLQDMSLQPCVYNTQWILVDGSVNLIVRTRSSDSFLGLPFNITQYSLLQHLISQITGYKVGVLQFQLGDVHLYDRHFEPAKQFINNPIFDAPKLWIDDTVVNYFDHSFGKTFKLVNYKNNVGNAGRIPAEICITKAELDRLNS